MTEEHVFRLPDLGEGLTEAEIVSWHVNEGDRVVAGQPLVSVETDKAVVEIPAPRAGVIAALGAAVGAHVKVGDPLITFEISGTTTSSAGVVGRLEEYPGPETTDAREVGTPTVVATPVRPDPIRPDRVPPDGASPFVRRLAQELGITLADVTGTGPGGVIVSNDIRAIAAGTTTAAESLRGPRRAMAQRMADAHARVVPATVTGEADIDAWAPTVRPLERLIRAIARAIQAVPVLNATFDDQNWQLRQNPHIDLGIAVETGEGLFVPVLRGVERRPVDDLMAEFSVLRDAVRNRTVDPHALTGQTLTLSNFGAVGGWHAAMVVVPPQVAIVGAGRAAPRVVAVAGRPAVHRVLPLSLTIDHRVITGIEACRFLTALTTDLEIDQ